MLFRELPVPSSVDNKHRSQSIFICGDSILNVFLLTFIGVVTA